MDEKTLSELSTERLEAEITTLAAHLTAAEYRYLTMIAEFDRREAYLGWGCRTAAFWLSWKCGLNIRSAHEKLRVARSLAALPRVSSEFAAGKLSYSKVRAITRIATAENEEELVGLALSATAAHVEAVVRAYRGVLSREEETERAVDRRVNRHHVVDWDDEGDGSLRGDYRLPPRSTSIRRQPRCSRFATRALPSTSSRPRVRPQGDGSCTRSRTASALSTGRGWCQISTAIDTMTSE
jgi:hypothetical protein